MGYFNLMAHAVLGSLLGLAGVWFFVDVLNAKEENRGRIKTLSVIIAGLMWLTYILAGYFYVIHYSVDKAFILKGPVALRPRFFHGIEGTRGDDALATGHLFTDSRLQQPGGQQRGPKDCALGHGSAGSDHGDHGRRRSHHQHGCACCFTP